MYGPSNTPTCPEDAEFYKVIVWCRTVLLVLFISSASGQNLTYHWRSLSRDQCVYSLPSTLSIHGSGNVSISNLSINYFLRLLQYLCSTTIHSTNKNEITISQMHTGSSSDPFDQSTSTCQMFGQAFVLIGR